MRPKQHADLDPSHAGTTETKGFDRRQALKNLVAAGGLGLGIPGLAHAQFRVDVAGIGLTQRPFAIAPFRGRSSHPTAFDDVVSADLERSGLFRAVPVTSDPLDESSLPDLAPWRARGIDALITGSVNRAANGRVDVRYRLWDVVAGEDLGGVSVPVTTESPRLAAHQVADSIFEKLTGIRGVFSTRIAYVTQTGQKHQLWVADADGEGAQPALTSPEPIVSPVWSPDGSELAYVSFESRKPVIYVHTVATGKRRLMANFKGSNSAPAWSPDGEKVVATLTLSGSSQVYLLSKDGTPPKRITSSRSIDTEPCFSPDGGQLYFVSNRGGSPQIYRMPVSGGGASRVTFKGSYNTSPSLSADGRYMAYISRVESAYRVHVMDLASGEVRALTDTEADESPSFAANSQMLIYATRLNGRDALMTVSSDGNIRTRLAGAVGDIREPDWGPFR
ncbi:MAG: Tol-Pal system beta propeller repeat protein TolB [Burkholderiaceae bacterium]|jgi:TolB protein